MKLLDNCICNLTFLFLKEAPQGERKEEERKKREREREHPKRISRCTACSQGLSGSCQGLLGSKWQDGDSKSAVFSSTSSCPSSYISLVPTVLEVVGWYSTCFVYLSHRVVESSEMIGMDVITSYHT